MRRDRANERVDDGGVECVAAGRHGADRVDELIALGDMVLQQVAVAGRTLGEQRHRVLGVVVLGEDHDAGARMPLAHLLGRVDALPIEVRGHPDVGDQDLGVQRGGFLHDLVVVGGDPDDPEVLVPLDESPNTLANDEIVVGQDHRDRARAWLAAAYLGYGGGDEGFFREIKAGGREKLRAYGRYIGKRFKDLPNIVWILGGDYTPEKPDQWVVNELATAIREEDPTHVMTAHHSPEGSAVTAFGEQEWLAINTVYGYEKTLYRPLLAQYGRKPVHAFVLLETTYEDEHDSTPDLIRRQAYWAMLAGACGQFFGNNPIWHFDGPTLFPFKLRWRQALGAAGSRDMALLRELFIHLPWQELAPEVNHSILTEGYGSDTATALTASTADGRLSITYIPSTGKGVRELTVALDGFAKPVSARWYNPTNGHFVEIDGSPYAHHGTQRLRSPDDNGTGANDWVLVLDAR